MIINWDPRMFIVVDALKSQRKFFLKSEIFELCKKIIYENKQSVNEVYQKDISIDELEIHLQDLESRGYLIVKNAEYEGQLLPNLFLYSLKTEFLLTLLNTLNQNNQNDFKTEIKKEITKLFFKEIFKEHDKYELIRNILIENKFCDKNSMYWIDEKKGSKGLLVAFLKELDNRGYFSCAKLTNKQIQNIALKSFNVKISLITIKKVSAESYKLEFIHNIQ